jgi:hypothetical protein
MNISVKHWVLLSESVVHTMCVLSTRIMKMKCVLQSNMVSNSDLRDMVTETRRRVRLAMISVSYLELKQHLYDLLQGHRIV